MRNSACSSARLRMAVSSAHLCLGPCSALCIAMRLWHSARAALSVPPPVPCNRDLHAALRQTLTALHTSLHIAATLHCLAALSQSLTLSQTWAHAGLSAHEHTHYALMTTFPPYSVQTRAPIHQGGTSRGGTSNRGSSWRGRGRGGGRGGGRGRGR